MLERAGIQRADLVIAVTGDDEDNMLVCQVAKEKYLCDRIIARVNNPRNHDHFRLLGIQPAVSATDLILRLIEHEVPRYGLVHLLALEEERLEIIELEVSVGAPTVGERVADISLPEGSQIISVLRDGSGFVPKADTVIEEGDEVLLVLDPGSRRRSPPTSPPTGSARPERRSPPTSPAAPRSCPAAAASLSLGCVPGWCNWQHASLWMSNLGFESLSRSTRPAGARPWVVVDRLSGHGGRWHEGGSRTMPVLGDGGEQSAEVLLREPDAREGFAPRQVGGCSNHLSITEAEHIEDFGVDVHSAERHPCR